MEFVGSVSPILTKLNDDRLRGNGTDITFDVGGRQFFAHRIILPEKFMNQKAILGPAPIDLPINDPLVLPEVMDALLTYLYTGTVTLTPENAQALCNAAHFFQADELVSACEKYLSGKVTAENVVELTVLADRLQLINLLSRCAEQFRRAIHLLHDPGLMQLTEESIERLASRLAQRPTGRVPVTRLINRWIEHDRAIRTKFETSLQESLSRFLIRTGPIDHLFCMGGRSTPNTPWLTSVSRFDSHAEQWKTMTPMARTSPIIPGAVIGTNIYIGGVWDKNLDNLSFVTYDCLTDRWEELPALPFNQFFRYVTMASIGDRIYVTAFLYGEQEEDARYGAFEYNPQNREWSPIERMLVHRILHRMVGLDGYIYAIGGNFNRRGKTVERYNPEENRWTMVASANYQHIDLTAAAHDERIYVYSEHGFEVYHPETDNWQILTTVGTGEDNCATLASLNGQLLLVGGKSWASNGPSPAAVYSYDEYTDQWSKHTDMDGGRSDHSSFVVSF